jgi:hypothetical protein
MGLSRSGLAELLAEARQRAAMEGETWRPTSVQSRFATILLAVGVLFALLSSP